MVSPSQRCFFLLGAALSALFLCQCATPERSYGPTRSSFSFDENMWGGQGGGGDSDEIRSKFAERGYQITEDGTIKADRPNLYSGQKARGVAGEFQTKKAHLKNRDIATKEFKTPEYLKRQEFAGVSSARESGSIAREGDTGTSRDPQAGRLFKSRAKNKSSSELALYSTGTAEEDGEVFETKADRDADKVGTGPTATGTPRTSGYQDNVAMSMDDVKKMLNPGAYARATGISQ